MADKERPDSARERLEAAKKAATDAKAASAPADGAGPAAVAAAVGAPAEPKNASKEKPDFVVTAEATPKMTPGAGPKAFSGSAETPEDGAPREPEPPTFRPVEPELDSEAAGAAHEEPEHRSMAGLILQWLAIFFIGAAAALWAGPRLAPYLPGWAAPVAAFLTPGADQTAEEIRAEMAVAHAELGDRIATLEAGAAGATEAVAAAIADAETRLDARIDEASSAPASAPDALTERIAATEAALAALRADVGDLSSLAAPDAAPAAAVATLGATVETLSADVADLRESAARIAPIDERLVALEGGEAATASARNDAEAIRRRAELDAAMTRIGEALIAGAPFAQPMTNAVALSGQTAPEPLAALADTGAPSARRLSESFPRAARAAYAASVEADAGEGFGAQLYASISGRVGGRPATETEGADAGAVLSRIEARLQEGRLAGAAAEAEALPSSAAAAMADWLTSLRRAVEGQTAFEGWRAALTANQGN